MGFPTLDGASYTPQYFQQPAQTVPPPQPQEQFHTVENGESLESIAQKYSTPEAPVTAQDIADRNQLGADGVKPGQNLIVPTIKQHAEPKAAPNATPEQGKSDQAMSKYLTAEDNLAAFDSGYQRNHNDPDYQPVRNGYAGQANTARTELRDAIGAEIKAEFAAHSRPTGDIFDAKAIEQYGAAVIKRYENDPAGKAAAEAAVKDFGVQHEVDTALSTANAMSDAKGAVESLSRDLPKLSPEAQTRLLSSPGFDKLMDEKIAPSFTEPLQGEPWKDSRNGPSAPPKESLLQLQALVEKAEPRVAKELAERGTQALSDFFQRAEDGGYSIRLGIEGTTALVHIAGRIGNTADGGAVVQRMADLPVDASQIHLAVAEGARPDLLMAISKAGGGERITATAIDGVKMYAGSLNGDVDKLAKMTDELTWLISNHGGSMTPDQLNDAIKQYVADQGAGWELDRQKLEAKVAEGGKTLLDQIESLRNAPPDQKAAADKAIEGILGDTKSSYAISLALKTHPDYIDSGAGKRLMQNLAYDAKLGEQGLKLTKELANAYIRNDVLAAAQNYDPRNPASIQQAEQAIERLKNPTLVKALGMDVDSSKYQSYVKLVDELKKSLPAAGDGTQQIVDKLKTHAEAMDNVDKRFTAEGHRPTFEKNQPVGQVLRLVGVGFATIGYLNSQGKANDGQFTLANRNDIKAIVDAASLGQKGTELAVGLGLVAENSALGRFGAGNRANDGSSIDPGRMTRADRVFGHLSAGLDYWAAYSNFTDKNNPDPVRGGLYAVSGVGGTMAALSGTSLAASLGAGSWLGPVGIGLVAIGTIGLTIKDRVDHSNAHMNPTAAKFLSHAGFDAATSTALVDQSGEGWSPVTLLARYATDKGYKLDNPADQKKFVEWVNGMDDGKLEKLRSQLHFALDDIDGDVAKFGSDTTVYRPETFIHGGGGMAVKVNANISTIGHLEAVIRDLGLPELPKA